MREPMLDEIVWSVRGFDPATPEFSPEVVILAGEFKSTNRSGFFEIKMRGRDLYRAVNGSAVIGGDGRSSQW